MLTVPQAARLLRRDPETVRRWIRSGRLRSVRVGTQHVIDEQDLRMLQPLLMEPLPPIWTTTTDGAPMPDVVSWLHRTRSGH